ncbi:MAG: FAD-dependent oxidoreductase, partial [Fidelibacterota bacterium]
MKNDSKKSSVDVELEIGGMTCDSCAVHVQNALESVEGVLSASVPHWTTGEASVESSPEVDTEKLVAAVKAAGYRATPRSGSEEVDVSTIEKGSADYDLVVIGTGGGGMGAALKAQELGMTVLIVEAGTIGGTCVNIGCVPSKTLIRAAEVYHKAKNHPFKGIDIQTNGVRWGEVVGQKDILVEELRHQKYEAVLEANSDRITLVRGRAKIVAGGVMVDDEHTYSAGKIVIATGARPRTLPLEGIEKVSVLTSTSIMSLDRQPGSLVIIGGRAIALELGQALSRLGTKVTLLQRSNRLIPGHEPEISQGIQDYLQGEGLEIHTGVTPQSIREENGKKIVTVRVGEGQWKDFEAEEIMMATGRTPNTTDLGLEEAGVETDNSGFILVDKTLQTTNPDIYAVGDVTTLPKLVYVAAAAGGIA